MKRALALAMLAGLPAWSQQFNSLPPATNISQVGGNAVVTAATGVQKVGIVGSSGAVVDGVIGNAAAPANMILVGGVYNSTLPTLTTGQSAALQVDAKGQKLVDVNYVAGAAVSTAASGVQKVGIVGNAGATVDAVIGNATAPTNQIVTGGVYNSTLPTLTTGQSAARQLDAKGQTLTDTNYVAGNAVVTSASGVQEVGIVGSAGGVFDQAPGSAIPARALQVGLSDGTNTRVQYIDPCGFNAWTYYVINIAANTQVVANVSAKNVYVCELFLAPVAGAANFNIVESATGGNACATSPSGMMGGATAALGAQNAINGGFVLPWGGRAWMMTAAVNHAVCIFASAQVTGVLAYVQF